MACPDQIDTEYHKQLIAIISSLPLQDDADVELLANELDGHIKAWKDIYPYKNTFTTTSRLKLESMRNAVVKLQKHLNELDETLTELIWTELDRRYETGCFDKYPSPRDLCNLLSPIEKVIKYNIDSSMPERKIKNSDKEFNLIYMMEDDLATFYVEASGRDLGKSNSSKKGEPTGPLYRFIESVFNLACIDRAPITTRDSIINRSK